MAHDFSRRRFLALTGTAAAATLLSSACTPPPNPFTLGVASGDPTPDGIVLWTRLARTPLADDGLGGMGTATVTVEWQLSTDSAFRTLVRTGTTSAVPANGHSVHVQLTGLSSGYVYFYRFKADGHLSPVGRTRTAPALSSTAGLLLAAASCAHYEDGFFTAYRRLAEDAPDLVLHLGDYIYEQSPRPGTVPRRHLGGAAITLANYRQRYAQYRTDPDLQAAHAAAPWLVVPDDHEVANNYAGAVPEYPDPNFAARRAAAYRAYWENMPLRPSSVPTASGFPLYRRLTWGRLVNLHLLDTRQYRDDQVCGDNWRQDCRDRLIDSRSMLGAGQASWLRSGLAGSTATWDVVAQQVFFARLDRDAGTGQLMSMDQWDGYASERGRLVNTMAAGGAGGRRLNPVVLTGDVHRAYANDIYRNWEDRSQPPVGVELVTSSVSSNGDGTDRHPVSDSELQINPHVRFANSQRGYVLARFGATEARADFRVLPYVSRAGAPVSTRAAFTIRAGAPALQRVV